MGLSLRKIKDSVVDVFSANTQADQQRRMAAGQARQYGGNPVVAAVKPVAQAVARVAAPLPSMAIQRPAMPKPTMPSIRTVQNVVAPLTNTQRNNRVLKQGYQGFKSTAVGDILKNPVTRFVDNEIIEPTMTSVNRLNNLSLGQNDYSGNTKQKFGQFGEDVLNAGSIVPIGKGVQLAAKGGKLLPRVVQGGKQGAKVGAGFGAGYGATGAMQEDQDLRGIIKGTAIGTGTGLVGGAVLGGGLPLAGAGVRATKPVAKRVNDANRTLAGRVNVQDQNILRDFSSMQSGGYNPNPSQRAALITQARQTAAKYGKDLSSGNPAQLLQRTNEILDGIGKSNRTVSQGGYFKVGGNAKKDLKSLAKEAQKYKYPNQFVTAFNKQLQNAESNPAKYQAMLNVFREAGDLNEFYSKSISAAKPAVQLKVSQPAQRGDMPVNSSITNSVNMPANGKAFGEYTDEILGLAGIDVQKGLVQPRIPGARLYGSAQQLLNKPADVLRKKTSEAIQRGIQSENGINAAVANAPNIAFKNFGMSDEARQILMQRTSAVESGGRVSSTFLKSAREQSSKLPGGAEQFNEKVIRILEDPEFLATKYGNPTKLTPDDLTPAERKIFDKMLVPFNKIRNDLNFETEVIDEAKHTAGASGLHSPRMYDQELFDKGGYPGNAGFIDRKAGTKRKDLSKIDDEIIRSSLDDPFQGTAVRMEQALRNKANLDALNSLKDAGLLLDRAPNKNFVPLEGKKYGPHEGKFIHKQILSQFDQKDRFNSNLGQKMGDTIDAYQESLLGKTDRLQKSFKTTLSPATGLGNVFSNIFAFSGASNVNPATAALRMAQASKQLAQHSKKFNANVYRAEKAGLFAGDTGKALQGVEGEAFRVGQKKTKNPIKLATSLYGSTDRAFALGIFNELKARGLKDKDAVLRTQRAMQNYSNAGRGINALADAPLLGKPFARFTPELLRIAKNNAIYNPVGTAAKVGTVAAAGNMLSSRAGETQEERKARETAVGQTQLPGTSGINKLVSGGQSTGNVSLNLPIGNSSVNIARLSGLNYPIEPGGDANSALARQLSPVADLTRKNADGQTVIAPNQAVSSLTLKPIADQLLNRDFMGRDITDPQNRRVSEIGAGKSQYENADGSRQSPGSEQERKNRIRAAAMSYLPLANEADALSNAARGKEDYYGKERTLKQGVLRTVGLKTESNDKAAREKRVSNKQFFEGKDKQVKEFLNKNKDLADSYFKFNDSARDRNTNKKSNSLVGPEKWSIVKGDASGRLYNQLKREALDQEKSGNKPVDPIYKLNDQAKVKDALFVRSTAPGDNVEKEEMLRATSNWYGDFEKAESDFYKANAEWFKTLPKSKNPAEQNDRVKAYGDIKYPEQSDLVKKYYQEKSRDPQAGKNFFKANADKLSADFDGYKSAKLDYLNQKRAILGLDPIKPDTYNNVTFGYEDDEAKVAQELYFKGQGSGGYGGYGGGRSGRSGRRGGGGGSGGGSGPDSMGSLYKYAVSLSAGGKVATPKVTQQSSGKVSVKKRAKATRPKVSLKKGKV